MSSRAILFMHLSSFNKISQQQVLKLEPNLKAFPEAATGVFLRMCGRPLCINKYFGEKIKENGWDITIIRKCNVCFTILKQEIKINSVLIIMPIIAVLQFKPTKA
ncbi:hypothetical protein ABE55_13885 [Bacillus thuringiensis]|uniref:hypothetical protein n=1 Tax=Bacillus cereus group TaxID=86661 RepID=UPI00137505C6|nr:MULTISPECIES: hypothetical protein [Bacillus cereus group]MBG9467632.1 hypothetical protein [Bacillus thuringiensis]